jgi:hypothetical protein
VRALLEPYGFSEARALIEAKKRGEQTVLDDGVVATWSRRIDDVFESLDAALRDSTLPEDPSRGAIDAVERWLLELRRARWT